MKAQHVPNQIWLNTVSMDSVLILKHAHKILTVREQISAKMMFALYVPKAFAKQIIVAKPPVFVKKMFVLLRTKTKEQPVVNQTWLSIAYLDSVLLQRLARATPTVLGLTSAEVAKFVQHVSLENVKQEVRAMMVFVLLTFVPQKMKAPHVQVQI